MIDLTIDMHKIALEAFNDGKPVSIEIEYKNSRHKAEYIVEAASMSFDNRGSADFILSRALGGTIKPKPRTNVVYERVTFKRVSEIFAILESGELLYTSDNGDSHIDLCLAMSREPCMMIDREFYRKVVKEIDWEDELDYYIRNNANIDIRDSIENAHKVFPEQFIGMCHLVASLTDNPE